MRVNKQYKVTHRSGCGSNRSYILHLHLHLFRRIPSLGVHGDRLATSSLLFDGRARSFAVGPRFESLNITSFGRLPLCWSARWFGAAVLAFVVVINARLYLYLYKHSM